MTLNIHFTLIIVEHISKFTHHTNDILHLHTKIKLHLSAVIFVSEFSYRESESKFNNNYLYLNVEIIVK